MADTVTLGPSARGRDPPEGPTLVGKLLDDRFRVSKRLARGGMGVVYRATDMATQTEVVLKVLHSALSQDRELVDRFLQEARAASSIGHPSIVQVLAACTLDGDGPVYYAMEYLHGEDLSRILRRRKRLSWRRTRDYALQIVRALQASHNAGIVHRDLKPANFFVIREDGAERVKLLDFGVAKISESSTIEAAVQTVGGFAFGTPAYMSPEQARGDDVDERTDIYAIAACLYECLTGEPPYDGANFMQVLSRVHTQPLVPPSTRAPDNVPPEVEGLILQGMARVAADRYQSMAEFEAALLAIDPEAQPQIAEDGPPSSIVRLSTAEIYDPAAGGTGKAPRDSLVTSADESASKGSFVGSLEFEEDPPDLRPHKGDTMVTSADSFDTPGGDTVVTPLEDLPALRTPDNTQVTPLHMLPGKRPKPLEYDAAEVAASAATALSAKAPANPDALSVSEAALRAPTGPHESLGLDVGATELREVPGIAEQTEPRRSPWLRVLGWFVGAALCIVVGGGAVVYGPSLLESWRARSHEDSSAAQSVATAPNDTPPPNHDADAREVIPPPPLPPPTEPEPEPESVEVQAPAELVVEAEAAADTDSVEDPDGDEATDEPEPPTKPTEERESGGRKKKKKKKKKKNKQKSGARRTKGSIQSGLPSALGQAEVAAGFRSAMASVRAACGSHEGQHVRIEAKVTGDGRVQSTTVLSTPDDGLGRCVAAAVRRGAQFAPFKTSTDTFLWTYDL